ncbi:DUF6356 family protein [Thiotrichales bacterium 19X7-9]|nr:DUF6356 family protein [Thiotrichales bacterium 19X7-9]TNF65985.1 MAG: hypothetical protein EP298_10590 [Gammaproteobacteria bacterium]UTW44100.1 hypothetical protein KFE69_12105 [bacterium SCSIO 12844]
MKNPFTEHPHSIGESYFKHMQNALSFGFCLFCASLACFIHALLPFLFKDTATNKLATLVNKLSDGKRGDSFNSKLARCRKSA